VRKRKHQENDGRDTLSWKHNFLYFFMEDNTSGFVKCCPTLLEERQKSYRWRIS